MDVIVETKKIIIDTIRYLHSTGGKRGEGAADQTHARGYGQIQSVDVAVVTLSAYGTSMMRHEGVARHQSRMDLIGELSLCATYHVSNCLRSSRARPLWTSAIRWKAGMCTRKDA